MLKLKKLYNLINRNVTLNLINEKRTKVYFYGKVSNIPDKYDLWKVFDIIEISNYEYEIIIAEN